MQAMLDIHINWKWLREIFFGSPTWGGQILELRRETPVGAHANGLLLRMAWGALNDLKVEECDELPAFSIKSPRVGDEAPDDLQLPAVSYAAVCNRLKVLANLNPVTYPVPVSGKVNMTAFNRDGRSCHFQFELSFQDQRPDAHFTINLLSATEAHPPNAHV